MLSFLCMAGKQFVDKKICTNFVAAHGVFLLKLRVSQDAKNKLPLGNWVKQAVGHIKAASSFPFSCIRNTEKKLSLFYSECHIPIRNVDVNNLRGLQRNGKLASNVKFNAADLIIQMKLIE
ncbi:hypothetical protein WN944_007153 [Citrus x changshan-huyou]|uniref:Uncharacterized protein n=1 Tax=Citrus x changshan-huyou TaxID=2935761 RepID=A0AAP0MQN0_9ROSI